MIVGGRVGDDRGEEESEVAAAEVGVLGGKLVLVEEHASALQGCGDVRECSHMQDCLPPWRAPEKSVMAIFVQTMALAASSPSAVSGLSAVPRVRDASSAVLSACVPYMQL